MFVALVEKVFSVSVSLIYFSSVCFYFQVLIEKCMSVQALWPYDAPGTSSKEGVHGPVEKGHPSERQTPTGEDPEEDSAVGGIRLAQ